MLVTFTGEVIQIGKQKDYENHSRVVHKVDIVLKLSECNGEEITKDMYRIVYFINEGLKFMLYFKKGDTIQVHVTPHGFRFENQIGEYKFANNDIVRKMTVIATKKKKPKVSKFCDLSQYVEQEKIPEDFNNNNNKV